MLSVFLIVTPIVVVAAVAWVTIWAQSRLSKRLELAAREFQTEIDAIEAADQAAATKFVDDLTRREQTVDQALREYQTVRPTILPGAGERPKPFDWDNADLARWRQSNWQTRVGKIRREIGRPVLLTLVVLFAFGISLECTLWHLQGTRRIAEGVSAAPLTTSPSPTPAPGFDPFADLSQPGPRSPNVPQQPVTPSPSRDPLDDPLTPGVPGRPTPSNPPLPAPDPDRGPE